MIEDTELLQRYAASHSGEVFAELVRRHLPLVYAAALRQVDGAVHRAEDVTQVVFVELARQARSLSRRSEIVGWLHTTTHHTAAKLKRSEQRRQIREQEAHIMQESSSPSSAEIEWERLRPVLDEAMLELNDGEREVILMRFFQARRFAEIGRRLELTEDAARMRVERALDKLRLRLASREITSTTSALAILLANQPAVAASTTLAATVTEAALAACGMAAGGAASAGAWATFMNMTNLQVGISSALAVAGASGFVLQARSNAQLRTEVDSLRRENVAIASLRAENFELARTAVEVAEMRRDDAEFARLNAEAMALKGRLQQVARAEQARAAGANTAADIFDRSKLAQLPLPIHQVRPQYPVALQSIGVGGEVLIEFLVDSNGNVRNARAVRTSLSGEKLAENDGTNERARLAPFTVAATPLSGARLEQTDTRATIGGMSDSQITPLLEAAAIDAVSQWKFNAGRKDGRNVSTRMAVPIVFTVDKWEIPSVSPAPKP